LLIEIQYYAAIWNLNYISEWNVFRFAIPLVLAGLVLPTGQSEYPSDLGIYFEQHGKWAVAALAIRGVIAILGNHLTMASNYSFNQLDVLILLQITLTLLFLFSGKRKLQVTFTILYGLALIFTLMTIYLI